MAEAERLGLTCWLRSAHRPRFEVARSRESLVLCASDAGFKRGDTVTIGNTIVTGASASSLVNDLAWYTHEGIHSTRWSHALQLARTIRIRAGVLNHKRSIGAALILALGVTSLTGCDVGVSAPVDVAVQAAGTSLRIAICFDTAPVGLKVDERGAGAQGEWTTVWSVAGEARIEAGQVLDESNIPALFGSDAQLDPYLPGKDKEVVVELIYPPGDGSAFAEFDGSKVVEATWLQTNGNTTTTPCAT